jgi:hypothetical protein
MAHIDMNHTTRCLVIFILIMFTMVSTGCRDNETPSSADRSAFEFIVVSDIHVRLPGNPDDGYYDNQTNLANAMLAVDLINEQYGDADFVAVSGDLVGFQ